MKLKIAIDCVSSIYLVIVDIGLFGDLIKLEYCSFSYLIQWRMDLCLRGLKLPIVLASIHPRFTSPKFHTQMHSEPINKMKLHNKQF